ncbi:MAG TPA: hypothetical protein DC054_09215 [Blastocatellia bacterium]|nr:hypothetical protein [Blastocatellia bacterium]
MINQNVELFERGREWIVGNIRTENVVVIDVHKTSKFTFAKKFSILPPFLTRQIGLGHKKIDRCHGLV